MNRRARLPGADELFRATGGQPATGGLVSDSAGRAAGQTALRRASAVEDELGGAGNSATPSRSGAGTGFAVVDNSSSGRSAADSDDDYRQPRPARGRRAIPDARPTGRERHDEKITVYCSPEELLQIEHARLDLRGSHGLAVDRGRIVREAIAVVLADLEAKGDASILVRRLRGH
jgi:hypothetical protein